MMAVVLLLVGLALSAFFSGSETGFYRVTRVRLVIDAVDGDWISWWLLLLTNHPALFVATTLIGNNVANYMTSLGVVLLTKQMVEVHANAAELIATILFSPIVFVYGELLPKYLFYNAPNLLLRRCAPLFLLFTALFAPVSALLSLLGTVLQTLVGETPLRVRPALARKELKEVLQEGQEAGILRPAQRRMAQNIFDTGARPVGQFCRTGTQVLSVREGTSRDEILHLAQRQQDSVVAIRDRDTDAWIGYVRVVDLLLSGTTIVDRSRPLMQLHRRDSLIHALIRMQSEKEEIAQVLDASGQTWGLVYASDVIDLLVRNRPGRFASARRRKSARPLKDSSKPTSSGTPTP